MFLFTLFIKGISAAIAAILAIVPVSGVVTPQQPHPTVTNLHQGTVIFVNPPNPLVHPVEVTPTPTVTPLPSASGYVNEPRPCPVCR